MGQILTLTRAEVFSRAICKKETEDQMQCKLSAETQYPFFVMRILSQGWKYWITQVKYPACAPNKNKGS